MDDCRCWLPFSDFNFSDICHYESMYGLRPWPGRMHTHGRCNKRHRISAGRRIKDTLVLLFRLAFTTRLVRWFSQLFRTIQIYGSYLAHSILETHSLPRDRTVSNSAYCRGLFTITHGAFAQMRIQVALSWGQGGSYLATRRVFRDRWSTPLKCRRLILRCTVEMTIPVKGRRRHNV